MIINSVYGSLLKVSPQNNNNNINSKNLEKNNLPDFFVKLINKSKSQKEKEHYYNQINNYNNKNNKLKKINNTIKINNYINNGIYDNINNIIKNSDINAKKNDYFKRNKIGQLQKRKNSESFILDIRRNRIIKNNDYQNEYFIEKERQRLQKKEKEKERYFTKDNSYNQNGVKKHIRNNSISNINHKNNNFSPRNKSKTKFISLFKSRRTLKINVNKKRYQKNFNENYSKLRNFLNHLYFMRKKYKLNNTVAQNLIFSNNKNDLFPIIKTNLMNEQFNDLLLQFKNSKDIEKKSEVNLNIINLGSPISDFRNHKISLSKSIINSKYNSEKNNNINNNKHISNSYSNIHNYNNDNNNVTPIRSKKLKTIKYNTIINIKKRKSIPKIKKEAQKEKENEKENNKIFKTKIKTRNYNHRLSKSRSNFLKDIKEKFKNYNLLSKETNKSNIGNKLYPLIRIENFREQYSKEENIEKIISKKMIELYFNISKNANLKSSTIYLNNDIYYYKLNKMYYDQLSSYMEHRLNWELIENEEEDFENSYEEKKLCANFEWKYYSNRLYYKKYIYNSSLPLKKMCAVNLFEKNYEIGNKKKMFIHLINYCDKVNLNVFKYVPFTVLINNTKYIEEQLEAFKEIFNFIEHHKNKEGFNSKDAKSIIINRKYNEQFIYENKIDKIKKQNIYINHNFLSHKNYWILKPTDLYQGKCIEISNSFDEIYKKCKKIFRGVDKRVKPELQNDKDNENNKNDFINNINNNDLLSSSIDDPYDDDKKKKKVSTIYISNELIIQKYLDNPLLYRKRKFDIRCFVLVDWNLNVFFCREGHLKASSLIYDIDNMNKFIHITNHSFQKKSNKFQLYETGNEISYNEFKNFLLEEKVPLENFDKIIDKMKFLVKLSFQSVGDRLIKTPQVLSFELFGYDFIIDNEYNPWILEINNNPGLSISSPVIEKIIPRMMDDAFRLTIDKIFNTQYSSECIDENGNYKSKYKLEGYNDDENIFEFLCNVKS